MNTWTFVLLGVLADVMVLGTILLLVAHFALLIIRQPAVRMAVSWGTLLGLAALCIAATLPVWPRQSLASLWRTDIATEEEPIAAALVSGAESAVIDSPVSEPTFPLTIPPTPTDSPAMIANESQIVTLSTALPTVAAALWSGGAALALSWIALGAWRAFRLVRTAESSPDWSREALRRLVQGKRRPPRLKVSELIASAVALGTWRPHILLPKSGLSPKNLGGVEAALAHEWAHIRHGDLWLLALERLLLPVFCLHPLFWLFRRRLRLDQELLADMAAAGDNRIGYAEALVEWARSASSAPLPPLGMAALSLWENPRLLTRRVEMLLQSPSNVSPQSPRGWRWLVAISIFLAVAGLSLVTLRPEANAGEGPTADETAPAKPKKQKKQRTKPVRSASPVTDPRAAAAPEAAAHLQLKVAKVKHDALKKGKATLGEILQEVSEDRCRLEGEVIVAELSDKQYGVLLERLEKPKALVVLSQPQIVTLMDQPANVQIGSEIPLVNEETVVNGKRSREIKFTTIGEQIMILPRLDANKPGHLLLEVKAQHSELRAADPNQQSEREIPAIKKHTLELELEVGIGQTIIIAEREPKQAREDEASQRSSLLLAITPSKVTALPPAPPESAAAEARALRTRAKDPTADDFRKGIDRLSEENAALRKQVSELQAKLVDLEVQLRWLRAAASPEGADKVSDAEFLRRVYLDLTGTLPTPEDTKRFLNDKDDKKRDKLIDKLLSGADYDKHFRAKWRDWVIERDPRTQNVPVAPPTGSTADPPARYSLGAASAAEKQIKIFRLKNMKATEAGKILSKLMEKDCTIAVDERTNSLIANGPPMQLEIVTAILVRLDEEVAGQPKQAAQERNLADLFLGVTIRNVEGIVQKVDADTKLVQISLGSDDGLKEGTTLHVYRVPKNDEPLYIGRLKLVKVQPKESAAEVVMTLKGFEVQKGDRAARNVNLPAAPREEVKETDPTLTPTAPTKPEEENKRKIDEELRALDIRVAEVNLAAATKDFERISELKKANAISEAEYDAAQVKLAEAEIALQRAKVAGNERAVLEVEFRQAEASLQAARAQLERLTKLGQSVPATELEAADLEMRRKEIDLQRAKIRLEGARSSP